MTSYAEIGRVGQAASAGLKQSLQAALDNGLRWTGRSVVGLYAHLALRMDVEWQAPLPRGPKIVTPNHPTTLDPFLMLHVLREPVSILVTGAAFGVPLFGRYIRRMGHIPVVQGNGRAAFEEAIQILRDGRTVVVFPEGSLSPVEGGLHAPRTGAARLALSSGAPIIPTGIHLDRNRVRPMAGEIAGEEAQGRLYHSGPYAVTVGRPIWFGGDVMDHEFVHTVSDIIMRRIAHLAELGARRTALARTVDTQPISRRIQTDTRTRTAWLGRATNDLGASTWAS